MNIPKRETREEFIASVLRATGPITAVQMQTHRKYGELYRNWSAALSRASQQPNTLVACYTPENEATYYFSK